MSHLEVISFLLEHASEDNVLDYVAKKIRASENYFSRFNEERLLTDFLISN
ncbi:MAG: hypothetical protein ACLFPF_06325 [Halanaerobiales bacterium]